MRVIKPLAAISLSLALIVSFARAQMPAGVKGTVNNLLQNSVEQHDQAVEDALEGHEAPAPEAAPIPGQLKTGWLTRKGRDGKDVKLFFAYPATLTKSKPTAGLIVLQEWWGVNQDMQQHARPRRQRFLRRRPRSLQRQSHR